MREKRGEKGSKWSNAMETPKGTKIFVPIDTKIIFYVIILISKKRDKIGSSK